VKLFFLLTLLFCSVSFASIKTVTVAYNVGNPPLKFQNSDGDPDGILIDIWKLWSKKTGVKIVFKESTFKQTVNMVKNGDADIHAGLFYTKDRDKFLDYSKMPIIEIGYNIFYHKTISKIVSIDGLKPYVIGVPEGYTNKFMQENLPDGLIKVYKNFPKLYRSAYKGEIKTFISPVMNYEYFLLNQREENQFYYTTDSLYKRSYYSAVKEGNEELQKLLNYGLSKITKKDIIKIYRKWIKKGVFSTLSTK